MTTMVKHNSLLWPHGCVHLCGGIFIKFMDANSVAQDTIDENYD